MATVEEETSFESASTLNSDDLAPSPPITDMAQYQKDALTMKYQQEQDQLIEQLKHEKLILEEWKTEVGLEAVSTVDTLQYEIEQQQAAAQQYQYEIEGLQTENHALNQQIQAYQDEIDKLQKEKPKLESQITHFEQVLNEQYLITQTMSAKEEELNQLKIDYESTKSSLKNASLELKTLRKENDDIKKENEQYQLLLDTSREQEIKYKNQVTEQQMQIQSLTARYNEISDKLNEETAEQREQLNAARHIANNLSDQLLEIHNFQMSSPKNQDDDDNNIIDNNYYEPPIAFGKPIFEKRRTLKIITDTKSLKLVDQIGSDEEEPFSKSPQMNVPALNIMHRGSSLPPVSEFQDDDDLDFDFDEKQMRSPVIVTRSNNDLDDEKEKLIKRRHSDSLLHGKEFDMNIMHEDEADHELTIDFPHYGGGSRRDSMLSSRRSSGISSISAVSFIDDDGVDKLLKRVSGVSYHKYKNGGNQPQLQKMDSSTRSSLKIEIIKYIDTIKSEYECKIKEEKEEVMLKYKKEAKQWEEKYKTLKREHKKRKLRKQQIMQKLGEKPVGGCKFWGWNLVSLQNPYCAPQQTKIVSLAKDNKMTGGKVKKRKVNNNGNKVRFAVPEDSSDTN